MNEAQYQQAQQAQKSLDRYVPGIMLGGGVSPKISEIERSMQGLGGAHNTLDELLNELAGRLSPVTIKNATGKGESVPTPVYGSELATSIQASAQRAISFNTRLRDLLDSLAI